MNNLYVIKNYNLNDMALFLAQITSCAKYCEHIPNREEWKKYLLGNSMFLPFLKDK